MDSGGYELRNTLSNIRRETIIFRRYLALQREAPCKTTFRTLNVLNTDNKIKPEKLLTNSYETLKISMPFGTGRCNSRGAYQSRLRTNKYEEASLVAAVFLPLSFLTGLLGINIVGIPDSDNNWAFLTIVLIMTGAIISEIILFGKNNGCNEIMG